MLCSELLFNFSLFPDAASASYCCFSLFVLISVFVLQASGTIKYLDKCYCPGKDPYLSRDANLRSKMYELQTEYTKKNLEIAYKPGMYIK